MTAKERQSVHSKEICESVLGLYAVLQEGRSALRIRRAKIDITGRVPSCPVDFLCDVELKSKMVFSSDIGYQEFIRLIQNGNSVLIPIPVKQKLGRVFHEYNLGAGGDYKTLYIREKNKEMREQLRSQNDGDGTDYNDGATA